MLYLPVNVFKGIITNMTNRPAANWGTSITPGQNTFPAYAEILGDIAYDCFAIFIHINSNGVSTAGRDTLVTLGFDFSGGTTYGDLTIANLLATSAGDLSNTGHQYYFPLYIPAGTAIAAKASVNNATVGTLRVGVVLFGRPTRPELIRAGSYVDTFGATTASSSGKAITAGTTNEGNWTEVTSGDTTKPYWWFQAGWGANDSSLVAVIYGIDLAIGDATNKEIVFQDQLEYNASTAEQSAKCIRPVVTYFCDVPIGQRIYIRMQCSGTADSNLSTCAYALGG